MVRREVRFVRGIKCENLYKLYILQLFVKTIAKQNIKLTDNEVTG